MAFPTTTGNVNSHAKASGQQLEFYALHLDQSVTFDAFLSTFNQSFNSTWNEETVYGRNDPIATFQGTTRKINVAWNIPAGTLSDAKANLKRCSALIQMVYPSYTTNIVKESSQIDPNAGFVIEQANLNNQGNALTLSKSPLLRLKYANLISNSSLEGGSAKEGGLLGWISSVSWTPALDMGTFVEKRGKIFPKVIDLSIDFNVIHEHELGNKSGSKEMINKNASGKFPFNF